MRGSMTPDRGWRGRRLVAAAVAGWLTLSSRVRAEEAPSFVVQWSAPVGCPDGDAVRQRVLSLTGSGVGLHAEGVVRGSDSHFHLTLRVKDGAWVGERELDATSCAELADSAAVILALSARSPGESPPAIPVPAVTTPAPSASAATPPPPAPIPTTRPVPSSAPSASETRHAAPASPGPSRVRIAALGAVDFGTLPHPAFGGGIGVFVAATRHLVFGVTGTVWLAESGDLPGLAGQGADFDLLTGDLSGCYGFRVGPFDVSPCAVVELAHVSATGFGATAADDSPTATWAALGVGGRGRWELGRFFALSLDLEGLAPTQGQSFFISGGGTVHVVGPVALRAYFGPEVRF